MKHAHDKSCPCPECVERRAQSSILRIVAASIFIAALAVIAFALAGCSSTVTPSPVESRQASFDQGEQNSGVLAMLPGNAGAIITPRARDRYNGLIAIYGRDLLPPIQADYGIFKRTDGTYDITAEALQKFILMNAWNRMGRVPAKTK